MENNLVHINEARAELLVKKNDEKFKKYLSTLKHEELKYEANYLMNESSDELNEENLRKSILLMEELASRASDGNISSSINKFAQNIREQINH